VSWLPTPPRPGVYVPPRSNAIAYVHDDTDVRDEPAPHTKEEAGSCVGSALSGSTEADR